MSSHQVTIANPTLQTALLTLYKPYAIFFFRSHIPAQSYHMEKECLNLKCQSSPRNGIIHYRTSLFSHSIDSDTCVLG